MFTGIITDIGRIAKITRQGDTRFDIVSAHAPDSMDLGASIACSGICLTVIDKGTSTDGYWFGVAASQETLDVTTASDWTEGTKLNLERALKMGDELGAHMASSHVDGVATIADITPEGDSLRFTFETPQDLMGFIAMKGSVTLDGTALTVNHVSGEQFGVNFIAHTQAVTTWGAAQTGDCVNLEIDVLARYVARLKQIESEQ